MSFVPKSEWLKDVRDINLYLPPTYCIEGFSTWLMEGRMIADEHWKEFGNRQDIRIFNMDYAKYLALDAAGKLLSCTARREGTLIGYLVFFLIPDTHASGGRMAESAFYYTVPCPTRGIILRGMIRHAVRRLLDDGVQYIRFRHRLRQTAQPILENIGFVLDEYSYSLDETKFRR